jgi:hypothetical protein
MADQPDRLSTPCVESETLAAFVEGKLDDAARQRLVAHLATCVDCDELVAEVIHTTAALDESRERSGEKVVRFDPPAPRPAPWSSRKGLAAVGGLVAIAASVMLIVLNRGTQLDNLVTIVGNERLILARPTGGFHYGSLKTPLRGPGDDENYTLLAEAAALRERAERTNAADDLHAAGVAQLMIGDDVRGVTFLESAVSARPGEASFRADLGAAYMSRFANRGDEAAAAAALAAFDQAIAAEPTLGEAWFNKAVLLERMNRPKDALDAWAKYLELPAEPGWHEAALRSRDALQRQPVGK